MIARDDGSNSGSLEKREQGERIKAMLGKISGYGVRDKRVLDAVSRVRRHAFIPEGFRDLEAAYTDRPLPIGHEQTISQPFIVAHMLELLQIEQGDKVLEIGAGSGYEAAVLSEMGADVYSIEIIPELAEHAIDALASEGYGGVRVFVGDGYEGLPEEAPFDAIVLTCAPEEIPELLVDQLREGGRILLPLGSGAQRLTMLTRRGARVERHDDIMVRFVPMVKGK